MHYLPLVGMALLAAGILVFRDRRALEPGGSPSSAPGLTGIGLGATVAPALFVAGFSLQSANLQRVFAIVELFRAVAAFMIAPIFVYFAANVGGRLGCRRPAIALWIGFGLAIGGARRRRGSSTRSAAPARRPPTSTRFLDGEKPAWYSPPLLARLRSDAGS